MSEFPYRAQCAASARLFSAELAFRLRVVAAHAGAKFSFFRQNGELSRPCR
jgi:hypothetical protein